MPGRGEKVAYALAGSLGVGAIVALAWHGASSLAFWFWCSNAAAVGLGAGLAGAD